MQAIAWIRKQWVPRRRARCGMQRSGFANDGKCMSVTKFFDLRARLGSHTDPGNFVRAPTDE